MGSSDARRGNTTTSWTRCVRGNGMERGMAQGNGMMRGKASV
jgi:hypothetical protein